MRQRVPADRVRQYGVLILTAFVSAGCRESGEPVAGIPSAAKPVTAPESIDLLQQLVVPRDQVRGEFQLVNGTLLVPAIEAAHLEFPVKLPPAYRLDMQAQRMTGNGSLNIGLVVGESQVMAVLEGWGNRLCGLSLVEGETGERNATTTQRPVFVPGRLTLLRFVVYPDQVMVECDGHRVIDWRGNSAHLSLDERFFQPRTPGRLILGGWLSEFRITEARLTALEGRAIVSPPGEPSQPLSTPASEGDGWQRVTARADGFSVRMPVTPTRTTIEGATQYIAETEQGGWLVTLSPLESSDLPKDAILDQLQSEVFDSGEAILRQTSLTVRGADAAREVVALDGEGDAIVVRYILAQNRMFQVMYVGAKLRIDAPETRRFLDSFELIAP